VCVFMMNREALFVAFVVCAACIVEAAENNRPIIGILDQNYNDKHTYIAASYVKWIESAGARVVPLFYTKWSVETMENMLKNINGVVFPGGGMSFSGKYLQQLQAIFKYAKNANSNGIHFPLWGTCLGFQELLVLAADDTSILDGPFDSEDLTLALTLTSAANQSNFFKAMPEKLKNIAVKEKVTYNNHVHGITPKHFNNIAKLVDFYNVLSTNEDKIGNRFVSTIEAKKYPFFGTQWHPEKILFEWKAGTEINHSSDSVELNGWVARFFVNECRKNNNHFSDTSAEKKALIYNYKPTYTGDSGSFMQCYEFEK